MNKAQRIARANRRTKELKEKSTRCELRAAPFQYVMASELRTLCLEMRRRYPGVWHSPLLERMENIAHQLDELTENGIAPEVLLAWQLDLPLD